MSAAVADAIERLDALAAERRRGAAGGRSAGAADDPARRGHAPTASPRRRPSTSSSAVIQARARGGRSRTSCSARAVTSSSPMPASAASSSASAPTRRRSMARADPAEAGASMTALAKRCARRRARRLRLGDQHSRLRSAAPCGPTPGRTAVRWRRSSREVEVLGADGAARAPASRTSPRFAYRESRFKHGDEIILGATIGLERGDPAEIRALVNGSPGAAAGDAAAGRPERRQRLPQPTRTTTPGGSSRLPG